MYLPVQGGEMGCAIIPGGKIIIPGLAHLADFIRQLAQVLLPQCGQALADVG
jgi:hypothetical protein